MGKHGALPETLASAISELVAMQFGLHFPRDRWRDLERGISGAARDFNLPDAPACARWLLSNPLSRNQVEVLAGHLTIGETYFFREQRSLEVLEQQILPELLRTRCEKERRLRIWSAGCSTGEEAYSIAMLLDCLIPDQTAWNITILASDINPTALAKAATGVYGEWSFRGAPEWIRARYFERLNNGRYALHARIRNRVTLAHLNLADAVYPSLLNNTNAMDVILCRNVLMYFTWPHISKVVANLQNSLVDGGWLVVSPSEASHALFPQFVAVNFPGATMYRKSNAGVQAKCSGATPESAYFDTPAPAPSLPWTPATQPDVFVEAPSSRGLDTPLHETSASAYAVAESLYQQGLYPQAAEAVLDVLRGHAADSTAYSLLARTLANEGRLADALTWCDRWITADKLDPAAHYLRAVVLVEQGDAEQARSSLQRAIFLHPNFVLAHFALGNLMRTRGNVADARKHFDNALHLLRAYRQDDLLPESDGLTAGRLMETIHSSTPLANAP